METALKKTNKKGFTLVELVIVIAVLAILAAIAIPTVTSTIDSANKNVDISNAQTVEMALKTSYTELLAGTWNGTATVNGTAQTFTVDNLTVAGALAHNNLGSALPALKSNSSAWKYANGRITVNSSTGTELTAGLTVKAVLDL